MATERVHPGSGGGGHLCLEPQNWMLIPDLHNSRMFGRFLLFISLSIKQEVFVYDFNSVGGGLSPHLTPTTHLYGLVCVSHDYIPGNNYVFFLIQLILYVHFVDEGIMI